jgi:hypothetical protein
MANGYTAVNFPYTRVDVQCVGPHRETLKIASGTDLYPGMAVKGIPGTNCVVTPEAAQYPLQLVANVANGQTVHDIIVPTAAGGSFDVIRPTSGDKVLLLVDASETVALSDKLYHAGNGKFQVAESSEVGEAAVAVACDTVASSDSIRLVLAMVL